jgi:hypothetical protein
MLAPGPIFPSVCTVNILIEGVPKVFATGSNADSYADTSGVAGVGV